MNNYLKRRKIKVINPKWDEEIIVIPREQLFQTDEGKEQLTFDGLETDEEVVKILMGRLEGFETMRRGGGNKEDVDLEFNAEANEKFKQPIPYVLIKRGNEIFTYTRLEGGGEERLHNQVSLGVGGHMNREDGTFSRILKVNVERELHEELDLNYETNDLADFDIIGFINDDVNEVGRVHIGILMVLEIPEHIEVKVKETDQLEGKFQTVEEIKANYEQLEAWSQIAIEHFSK